jgi:hypothetical protein
MIFRFDLKPMEKELEAARGRGVAVPRAHSAPGFAGREEPAAVGAADARERHSRARTGDAFTRYHGKMMIVDREELHVYGFNFTSLDLKSRSFGIVTKTAGPSSRRPVCSRRTRCARNTSRRRKGRLSSVRRTRANCWQPSSTYAEAAADLRPEDHGPADDPAHQPAHESRRRRSHHRQSG